MCDKNKKNKPIPLKNVMSDEEYKEFEMMDPDDISDEELFEEGYFNDKKKSWVSLIVFAIKIKKWRVFSAFFVYIWGMFMDEYIKINLADVAKKLKDCGLTNREISQALNIDQEKISVISGWDETDLKLELSERIIRDTYNYYGAEGGKYALLAMDARFIGDFENEKIYNEKAYELAKHADCWFGDMYRKKIEEGEKKALEKLKKHNTK